MAGVGIREPGPGKGSRNLFNYIRSLENVSIPRFCEEHGLDRFMVEKAIKGRLRKVDVSFAMRISDATGGAVAVTDWGDAATNAEPALSRHAAATTKRRGKRRAA